MAGGLNVADIYFRLMIVCNRASQTGDALWVARSKADPSISYVLDYVVEEECQESGRLCREWPTTNC